MKKYEFDYEYFNYKEDLSEKELKKDELYYKLFSKNNNNQDEDDYQLNDEERIKKNKKSGFIRIYRSIQKSNVFKDSKLMHLYLYCILKAKYVKTKDDEIETFITTMNEIKKSLNWKSRSTVMKYLELLSEDNLITYETSNRFTKIVVNHYKDYQNILTINDEK